MNKIQSVEDYCTNRSWRLRLRLQDSRWLIGLAASQLPDRPPRLFQDRFPDWHDRIVKHLEAEVRHKCGNPVVVWVLLNVIVPIVVKLVLQWWFSRKEP
jgi:hypothetical protein